MAQPTHDEHCYFDDGNIVLKARSHSRNAEIVYCVHRSLLVRASPAFFGNMFSMPPPPIVPMYGGHPVVDMPDDADTLGQLIRFLYDAEYFHDVLKANDFTLKILGPCQLAHQYQVDWITSAVGERLKESWPHTLVGWISRTEEEQEAVSRELLGDINGEIEPHWEDKGFQVRLLPEPVSSILLARLCNVPEILPFAFLDLLRSSLEPQHQFSCYDKQARMELLPADDWPRIYRARERINIWLSHHPDAPYESSRSHKKITACQGNTVCEAAIKDIWLKLWRYMATHYDITQFSVEEGETKGVCMQCQGKLGRGITALQVEFWESSARFFSLV
ncbi:BTB domain-containing protein [Favolaschia claudopus]|uniref:BTB domain-containing protein n=1 Tax=Favolaschia claudopus TaxID=2862362 RepID=A0AAW0A3E3_9AGAR